MKKSTIKKALLSVALTTSMIFSMNTASAASINALEWVRDAYPDALFYVLITENGQYYTQVWTSNNSYILVKCEELIDGKCFISK
ncbi:MULTISPECIES: hypothetical protein [Bacillus]|uniref:hypothetical protein n=1 Tax=Bacillus TaxID=1386 RepID=UPI0011A19147|nr:MULTISPECIES: hypothetical protein [Bacillus]MBU8726156.1 hypothetical protein [Bacillus pumilus]MCP1148559.1 hypothetical protein [Bacillus sp. 1735sda2]